MDMFFNRKLFKIELNVNNILKSISDMVDREEYFYIRESWISMINKRHYAEKKIVITELRMHHDLLDLILDYSRISDKFIESYSCSFRIEKRYNKITGLGRWFYSTFVMPRKITNHPQYGVHVNFCTWEIPELDNSVVMIAYSLCEILESIVPMDSSHMTYYISTKVPSLARHILYSHRHEIANDLLQLIVWQPANK